MPFLPKEIREQPEFAFKLVDYNEKEDYAVWDVNAKTFLRSGQMIDFEGKTHELKETKFMPGEQFKKLFPGKAKSNRINREVIINEEQFTYGMPITVNNLLKQQIAAINAMGQNPLAFEFKVKRTGEGLKTRYEVSIANSQQSSSSQPVTISTQSQAGETRNTEQIVLTDVESQLVSAIRQKQIEEGRIYTFDQVKDNFIRYNITEARAKNIFVQELE